MKKTEALEALFQIEDKVPVPKTTKRNRYPFFLLKVGQSFWVPKHLELSVRSQVSYHNRNNGPAQFICRVDGDGARVWRVK